MTTSVGSEPRALISMPGCCISFSRRSAVLSHSSTVGMIGRIEGVALGPTVGCLKRGAKRAASVSRVSKAMKRVAAQLESDLGSSMVRTKPIAHVAVHLDHETPGLSHQNRGEGSTFETGRARSLSKSGANPTPCSQHSEPDAVLTVRGHRTVAAPTPWPGLIVGLGNASQGRGQAMRSTLQM